MGCCDHAWAIATKKKAAQREPLHSAARITKRESILPISIPYDQPYKTRKNIGHTTDATLCQQFCGEHLRENVVLPAIMMVMEGNSKYFYGEIALRLTLLLPRLPAAQNARYRPASYFNRRFPYSRREHATQEDANRRGMPRPFDTHVLTKLEESRITFGG